MNTNTIDAPHQEDIVLLNTLTRLLEEQINVFQCSDVSGRRVETLAEQVQSIVNEIAGKGLLDLEQFQDQREHIKRLFDNLNLTVIARKDETKKQLNQVRKGRKTIGTYRNNI